MGIALLVLGMITAFVGGLYALMEHNIQRLLAYHTGKYRHYSAGLGAGVTGIALEQPALIALGTVGGLYHLLNHSLFKSVLFLGAGASGSVPVIAISKNSVVLARKCRLSPSPC